MPEQTVNETEWRSVHPGALRQKRECLILFLQQDWDLHMDRAAERFIEVSR